MPDRCDRCHQPVPPRARRCPTCQHRLTSPTRNLSLIAGVIGLLALLAIIGLSIFVARQPDPTASDSSGDRQTTSKPAPPPKKPPLD